MANIVKCFCLQMVYRLFGSSHITRVWSEQKILPPPEPKYHQLIDSRDRDYREPWVIQENGTLRVRGMFYNKNVNKLCLKIIKIYIFMILYLGKGYQHTGFFFFFFFF